MAEEKNAVLEVHTLVLSSPELLREMEKARSSIQDRPTLTGMQLYLAKMLASSGVVFYLEGESKPTNKEAIGELVTGEMLGHELGEEGWSEATITAMRQSAERGFVAPDQHLASIRTLIQRAMARDV